MTGMILAGAAPLEAVQLQIIVMYMLIGAAAFTGLAATFLSYRQFFTANHQLLVT
jgi:putative ABC transport system permease protein